MRTVHKFQAPVQDVMQAELPAGARVVHVEPSEESHLKPTITLWVELDTALPKSVHVFHLYGTGREIGKGAEHLFTFRQGPFVWHLYKHSEQVLPIGMGAPTLAAERPTPRRPLGAK